MTSFIYIRLNHSTDAASSCNNSCTIIQMCCHCKHCLHPSLWQQHWILLPFKLANFVVTILLSAIILKISREHIFFQRFGIFHTRLTIPFIFNLVSFLISNVCNIILVKYIHRVVIPTYPNFLTVTSLM